MARACALAFVAALLCFAGVASAEEHDAANNYPRHISRARELAIIEAKFVSSTVPCDSAVIGTAGGAGIVAQTGCANFAWNATSGTVISGGGTGSGWRANANIDPPINSYFPANNLLPAGTSDPVTGTVTPTYNAQVGLRLSPQPGWGGGPNVTLGPPATNVVWAVHSTPATHAQASGSSVVISWSMGTYTQKTTAVEAAEYAKVCAYGVSSSACTYGVLNGPSPSPAAFVPAGYTFASTITYTNVSAGTTVTVSLTPTCLKYTKITPDASMYYKGWAYMSPFICHVTLTNLSPKMRYSFTISATATMGATSTTYTTPTDTIMTGTSVFYFTAPLLKGASAASYPLEWVAMADVGQTYNSSITAQYIARYISFKSGVDLIANVGDLAYGDDFGPDNMYPGVSYSNGANGNPIKWDTWGPMWQPVLGAATSLHAPGNHEMEAMPGQAYNPILYTDTSATLGFTKSDSRGYMYPYQGYATRYPSGVQIPSTYGDVWKPQFFSQDLGPVHVIVITSYVPFVTGTEQHKWFSADIAAVDRTMTPWLVVMFHVPPYHTYVTHYKEAECFLAHYEDLFYQYRVDFVLNGHVHAYERTHPVYKYKPDSCGPVYLTLGDGGNTEGPYRNYMDEIIPGSNPPTSYCVAASGSITANLANGNTWTPSYQAAAQPPSCPTLTFQPGQNGVAGLVSDPGIVTSANPSGTPTSNSYWCQAAQPSWSAYRDPSFGFSAITFLSNTTATFNWYRNLDQDPAATGALTSADSVKYTRSTTCSTTTPTLTVTTDAGGNPTTKDTASGNSITVSTDGATTTTVSGTVTIARTATTQVATNSATGAVTIKTMTVGGAIIGTWKTPAGDTTGSVQQVSNTGSLSGTAAYVVKSTMLLSVAMSSLSSLQRAQLVDTICTQISKTSVVGSVCTGNVAPSSSRRRALLTAGDTEVSVQVTVNSAAMGTNVTKAFTTDVPSAIVASSVLPATVIKAAASPKYLANDVYLLGGANLASGATARKAWGLVMALPAVLMALAML